MKADDIAHALKKVVDSGTNPDTAISSLKQFLQKKGALSLMPQIVRALLRIQASEVRKLPSVRVAKESDAQAVLEANPELKKHQTVVIVDPTLIGGHVIRHAATRTDSSYKGSLLNLYHRITTKE
ncbi:MAG: hypothetical protein RI911_93 [Candidatus Parcubacteria bacterium]|jgi:F0F1-type ATP synthase delta subunit